MGAYDQLNLKGGGDKLSLPPSLAVCSPMVGAARILGLGRSLANSTVMERGNPGLVGDIGLGSSDEGKLSFTRFGMIA